MPDSEMMRFIKKAADAEDAWWEGHRRVQAYLDTTITIVVATNTVGGAQEWAFNPQTRTLAVSADLEQRARDVFPGSKVVHVEA